MRSQPSMPNFAGSRPNDLSCSLNTPSHNGSSFKSEEHRDPVQLGLVASLNRPGGNLTGFNNVASELGAKGLALLHELVPGTETIGFLENPNNATSELTTRDMLAAAPVVGLKVQILKASNDREIDAAFVSLVQARTGALLVANDLFSITGSSGSLNLRHTTQFRPCTRFVSS